MSQNQSHQQTVKLAIDCETGEILSAEALLKMTDAEFAVVRREAMSARIARRKGDLDALRFQCAICKQPLFLSRRVGGAKNRWFVHDGKSEHCPWYEGNHLSPNVTKALIYRGQQEGAEHRRLKQFIANWLAADPSISNVSQEQTTFSEVVKGELRRPDVKCLYRGLPLVFEIQLSYTFLSDVIARDDFYKREGIYIIWVFKEFDLKKAAVADEVFFNRRNLFVLDANALNQTTTQGALTFTGHYQTPSFEKGLILDAWERRNVGLKDIIFPKDTMRPYFFDYDAERKNIEIAEQKAQLALQEAIWKQGLAEYLDAEIKYCKSDYAEVDRKLLFKIVDKLSNNEFWRSDYEALRDGYFYGNHAVLPALLSIRAHKTIGYDVTTVFQVIESSLRRSHPKAGKHAFAILYLSANKVYCPDVNMKQQDWIRNFENKVKSSIAAGERTYRRFDGFDESIKLFFPELKEYFASKFGILDEIVDQQIV